QRTFLIFPSADREDARRQSEAPRRWCSVRNTGARMWFLKTPEASQRIDRGRRATPGNGKVQKCTPAGVPGVRSYSHSSTPAGVHFVTNHTYQRSRCGDPWLLLRRLSASLALLFVARRSRTEHLVLPIMP